MYSLQQILSRVRVLIDEKTPMSFEDTDLVTFINDGLTELWKVIKANRADFFFKAMKSTGSTVTVLGRSYNPTSLKIVKDITSYILPPDLSEVKYVKDINNKYRFRASDCASEFFKLYIEGSGSVDGYIYYDIVGNTLLVSPVPSGDIDIEIGYIKKLSPLLFEGVTGTVAISGIDVTGVGTNFSTGWVGKMLIAGTLNQVYIYPYIVSVAGATALTLSSAYPVTIAAGASYKVSDILPEEFYEHTAPVVSYTVARAKGRERSLREASMEIGVSEKLLIRSRQSTSIRQIGDSVMVDPYLSEID